MIKNHALFKKIAIATLVIAPIAAEIAARQSPAPEQPVEAEAANSAPPAPSSDAPPPAPVSDPVSPLQQQAPASIGLMDTKPSLDPTAVVSAMAPQAAMGQPESAPSADGPSADAPPGVSADGAQSTQPQPMSVPPSADR